MDIPSYVYKVHFFIIGHPYYCCVAHEDDVFIEWKNTAGVKCHCKQKAKKLVKYHCMC